MRSKLTLATVAGVTALAALAGCAESSAGGDSESAIDLVAYSTPQLAFEEVQSLFADTEEGDGISFTESYGPSGGQSRAVEGGQAADFVNFSLESDVTRLVDADLIADDWNSGPTEGIIANSVVAFVVREGNPKGIETWEDLVRSDVEIVTPNPGSSGGARWNILAAWGQVIANGGSEADAEKYLTDFFENTVSLPGSARDALTAFNDGTGDVLISYENEAILARASGEELDYIVPGETLLIETPAAVTVDAPDAASDFLDFVLTPDAQAEFAKVGYRPVIEGVEVEVEGANDPTDPYPAPKKLLTVAGDFDGWPAAAKKFFDEGGIVPEIQEATGKTE